MSTMEADGPALLAAAVEASIKAMAPRRTTTGIAAAVAGAILAHQAAARAEPAVRPSVPAGTRRASPAPANTEASPEDLLEALREAGARRGGGRKPGAELLRKPAPVERRLPKVSLVLSEGTYRHWTHQKQPWTMCCP